MATQAGDEVWPLRPTALAAIGLVAAVAIQQLVLPATWVPVVPEGRIALATAIGTGALAFGFAAERVRLGWTIAFALVAGVTAGLVHWWSGGGGPNWFGDWRFAGFFLAAAVATPLFQAARDAGGWRFDYRTAHGHAWTDVVLWFASWTFAGIALALAWLLAGLFELIGLSFLRRLLEHDWCWCALIGVAFGAGLGLLRERDRVVRLLQRVVTAVLAVLAPVLGAGLALFLLALPFTGLGALWSATRAATPTLLGCAIGALILANAVIGDGEEDEARGSVLRTGAAALAACVLPLTVLAAVATGLRLHQYGLTPDRLWALVFVVIATAYGVAYLAALGRGRRRWPMRVRAANLSMAFVIVGVGLFLALPLVSFNALATRSQLARLRSGAVAPEKFDWAGLAFDFGPPGRAALARLGHDPDPRIAALARSTGRAQDRWDAAAHDREQQDAAALVRRLRVLPRAVPVPPALIARLLVFNSCGNGDEGCTLLYTSGATEAVATDASCFTPAPVAKGAQLEPVEPVRCAAIHYRLIGGDWVYDQREPAALTPAQQVAVRAPYAAGRIEVRPVTRRQLFVGDVPVGEAFE